MPFLPHLGPSMFNVYLVSRRSSTIDPSLICAPALPGHSASEKPGLPRDDGPLAFGEAGATHARLLPRPISLELLLASGEGAALEPEGEAVEGGGEQVGQ